MSPVYNCEGRHCSFMNTSMCTLRLNKEVFTLCIVLWVKAHFYCTFKILSVYLSRSISVFIIHLFIHLFICIMYVMHIVWPYPCCLKVEKSYIFGPKMPISDDGFPSLLLSDFLAVGEGGLKNQQDTKVFFSIFILI